MRTPFCLLLFVLMFAVGHADDFDLDSLQDDVEDAKADLKNMNETWNDRLTKGLNDMKSQLEGVNDGLKEANNNRDAMKKELTETDTGLRKDLDKLTGELQGIESQLQLAGAHQNATYKRLVQADDEIKTDQAKLTAGLDVITSRLQSVENDLVAVDNSRDAMKVDLDKLTADVENRLETGEQERAQMNDALHNTTLEIASLKAQAFRCESGAQPFGNFPANKEIKQKVLPPFIKFGRTFRATPTVVVGVRSIDYNENADQQKGGDMNVILKESVKKTGIEITATVLNVKRFEVTWMACGV